MSKISLTVIIPSKNEEKNIGFCLEPLVGWAEEIIVVDSLSTDDTQKIADDYGARIIQFEYKGGWPKKRQHVLDSYPFKTEWILLLDCDEILNQQVKEEIAGCISQGKYDGFYLYLQEEFLNSPLKYSVPGLRKLSLFKTGKGCYEMRLENQDISMGDMEVHEHVVVSGRVGNIKHPIRHRNLNSIAQYITKHNEYSNYEAALCFNECNTEIEAKLFGAVEQRRRWLKKNFIKKTFTPFLYFIYLYFFRLGFLDGRPGFSYIMFRCIQVYFISTKIYEKELCAMVETKNDNKYNNTQ